MVRPAPPRDELPTGTVTFLVVDLDPGPATDDALVERHGQFREIARASRGAVLDSDDLRHVVALFTKVSDAVDAAVAGLGVDMGNGSVAVRRAMHTGESERHTGRFGGGVTRTVQLAQDAPPGEIVLSRAAAMLARDGLRPGLVLEPCGEPGRGRLRGEVLYRLRPAP